MKNDDRVRLTYIIPRGLKDHVKLYALVNRRSITGVVIEALEEYFKKRNIEPNQPLVDSP